MSTRDALLDAIAAADPDDPVPRLVFADFLDEEGEPDRAAFVRLCGRLAADPDDGPTAAAAGRMLADHRAAWFGGVYAAFGQPLPAVPPNRGWLARGFRRLTLRGGGLLDEDCNRPGLGGRYGWLPNGQAGKYDEPPLPVGALALAFGLLAEMEFRPAAAPDPAALGPAIAGHPVRSLKVALPDPPAWEALTGPHLRRVARLEIDPARTCGGSPGWRSTRPAGSARSTGCWPTRT